MIKIKRSPVPDFLTKTNNKWQNETTQAIDYYQKNPAGKEFVFKLFNDPELKAKLKEIFIKCAYCESKYEHVYDGDVEHFRPKGKVSEKNPKTPGYYWLANDWNNLFLSCQHCNQRRRHIIYGQDTVGSFGKRDQFPLADETLRVARHDADIASEEPSRLLINPCIDEPALHFEYEPEHAVMVPLTDMARKSIEVYALHRKNLVDERNDKKVFLFKQIERVKREFESYLSNPTTKQKDHFNKELEELELFTKSDQEFAGMARFFVRIFLKENKLA